MNGHVESEYSIATGVWSAPYFVEDPLLRIHGLAPGLNYGVYPYPNTPRAIYLVSNTSVAGQQAFEGMKGSTLLTLNPLGSSPFAHT